MLLRGGRGRSERIYETKEFLYSTRIHEKNIQIVINLYNYKMKFKNDV